MTTLHMGSIDRIIVVNYKYKLSTGGGIK
jgi:hypothetical protein